LTLFGGNPVMMIQGDYLVFNLERLPEISIFQQQAVVVPIVCETTPIYTAQPMHIEKYSSES
jgi:hypothetical protein